MKHDLVIKKGTVVTAVAAYKADVAVDGEKVTAVGQDLAGFREIDAAGKLVTPGAVDIHVHLQMPIGQFTSTDDFYSGTVAAAFGGTTTIVDFVETQPQESMVEAIAARRALADPQVVIDYGLHMTISPSDIPKLAQVPAAFAAGCTTFKLYMAYGHRLNDCQLEQALTAVAAAGGLAVIHAENWDIIQSLISQNLALGHTQPAWHPRSRPPLYEGEATARVLQIVAQTGTPAHIFHVSCAPTVKAIAAARAAGLPVTAETCPQYLFLTDAVFTAEGVTAALPVCSPPIRDEAAQQALWAALQQGDLQVVATDHCPFTQAEKRTGLDRYDHIPGGVPSIEMRFAAIYSEGVKLGRLSLSQWVDLCCTTPARIAGLAQKGVIAPGFDADLVIFNPEKTVKISPHLLHETAGWTPYEGLELAGQVETTMVRGKLVVAAEELQAEAGSGHFIRRTAANL